MGRWVAGGAAEQMSISSGEHCFGGRVTFCVCAELVHTNHRKGFPRIGEERGENALRFLVCGNRQNRKHRCFRADRPRVSSSHMHSTHASSPLDEALLPSDNVPPSWYLPRLFRQPIFVLLPLGVIGPLAGWFKQLGDLATFAINLIALAPLALLLATATDELGKHTGQTFAGLINASMGNAFELIISLQALRAGLLRLLQLQLLGSILANALLLTGACFVAGGIAQHTQQFDRKTVFVTSAALLVAVLALCIPTAYTATQHHSGCPVPCVSPETLHISRWASLILVICYAIYLYWSTATHPAKLPPQSPGRAPQAQSDLYNQPHGAGDVMDRAVQWRALRGLESG